MDLHLVIAQYKQSYPGQLAPNVMEVWTEGEFEANDTGFFDKLKSYRKDIDKVYDNVARLTLRIDDDVMRSVPDSEFNPDEDEFWGNRSSGCTMTRLIVVIMDESGDQWPQIEGVWDEYVLEDNYEGFRAELNEIRQKYAGDNNFLGLKVVEVAVPDALIEQALRPEDKTHEALAFSMQDQPAPVQELNDDLAPAPSAPNSPDHPSR